VFEYSAQNSSTGVDSVEHSGQLPHRAFHSGKLGEYSDKSDSRIGNLAEYSDKVETMELIAHQKRTLLRQWMKICLASFLWKSDLFFSHESDCGNPSEDSSTKNLDESSDTDADYPKVWPFPTKRLATSLQMEDKICLSVNTFTVFSISC
jgi:hypothetical protein